jgi:hypothetical protein
MYSTCLFCNRDLGRNEVLDGFPIGSRLAFDAARGRLWVICRSCERWNLSPLEERWEAVEQAETYYHGTRRRVASEHVGLARLSDGTELVRIGEPLRPEFAAWRYGDQFGRRRRRQLLYAGAGLAVLGAGVAGGVVAGASVAIFGGVIGQLANGIIHGRAGSVIAQVNTESTGKISICRRHLAESRLVPGDDAPLALELRFKGGETRLEGRDALRVTGALMPHINRFGGRRRVVESAVGSLEESGGPEGYLERLARYAHRATKVPYSMLGKPKAKEGMSGAFVSGLFGLTATDRLALEMALHEEAEMRALHGQLAELERAWREAEEIAGIADSMFLPSGVHEALARIRGG